MTTLHELILDIWSDYFKDPSNIEGVCFKDLLTNTVSELVSERKPELFNAWKEIAPAERAESEKFCERNCVRWAKGFEALEFHIELCRNVGEDFISIIKENPDNEKRFLYEAIIRNHAKACLIANEIYCLLRNGYPDGAEARWRALYEVAVISKFIFENGEDCAEQYLLHSTIDQLKIMEKFDEHAAMLNETPLSDEVLADIRSEVDGLLIKYGTTFKQQYGWACSALGRTNGRINFTDIESSLSFDHWRPYFAQACNHIHAGSFGLSPLRALSETKTPTLLAGQSNSGMSLPGHMTAISLMHATFPLLELVQLIDTNVYMKIIMETANDVGEAFKEGKITHVDVVLNV